MSDHSCILRLLSIVPSEACILLSPDAVLAVSQGAQNILEEFGSGNILKCSRACEIDRSEDHELPQLKNVNSRQKYLGRGNVRLRFNAHEFSTDSNSPPAVLVIIQRLPLYGALLEQNEVMEFLLETMPVGVGLHKLDPVTGLTTHPYVNKRMGELYGVNVSELKKTGRKWVVTDGMMEEERLVAEAGITEAYAHLSSVTLTINMPRPNGKYAPTKFTMSCFEDDDGKVQSTIIGEEGVASDIEPLSVRLSARLMLSSFLSAVFDVSFYVNSKFQFVEESTRVREFFSLAHNYALVGKPIEVFMGLEDDKQRFRQFMVQSLEQQLKSTRVDDGNSIPSSEAFFHTPSRLMYSVAPMIELRLLTGGDVLSDCQIFATPTYRCLSSCPDSGSVGSAESSYDSNNANCEPVYLVGVRILRSISRMNTPPTVAEFAKFSLKPPKSSSSRETVPSSLSYIPEELQSYGQEVWNHRGTSTPSSDQVDEPENMSAGKGDDTENISGNSTSYAASCITELSCGAGSHEHSGSLIISKLVRDLHSSISELLAVSDCDASARFNPDMILTKDEWLMPVYEHNELPITEQELLLWLPNNLQQDFLFASRQLNFLDCSQILSYSIEGNIGILDRATSNRLVKKSYMIKLVFRFFFGMVQGLDESNARQLLRLLERQLACIAPKRLSRTEHRIIQLHLSISLISVAIKYRSAYTTNPADLQWLRKSFITALALQSQCTSRVKATILPIVYYMCLLWGGLMKSLGRTDEAINLLANVQEDISRFCTRHSYTASARQIQAMICYNISVTSLSRGHLKVAFHWLSNLQTTVEVPFVEFPSQCKDILEWAKFAQERAQLHPYHVS